MTRQETYSAGEPEAQTFAQRWQRLARIATVFLSVVAICGFLDTKGGWGFDWLELYAYNARMVTYQRRNPMGKSGQQIVLVTLTDETFDPDNPESLPGPPVPRDYHAKVIHNLTEAGAKVIAFDLIFDVPRPQDPALAAAARNKDNLLWAAFVSNAQRLIKPNKTLLEANPNFAHVLVPHDPVRPAVDHIQAFVTHKGKSVPSFSLQTALMAKGLDHEAIHRVAGRWQIGDFILPVDADGNFQISFMGKTDKVFPQVPYEALYRPGPSADFYRKLLRNKIVLIGDTTKVGNDILYTPVGNMPGVEVHANAIATLLQGRFVRAVPPWVNVTVLCLLVVLICLLATLRRVKWVVLASAVIMGSYFVLNIWLFVDGGITLHLIGPLAAMILATLGVLIERGLTEEFEKERMFDSLVLAAASAIEARDPSTAGHSQRVTVLTLGLAQAVTAAKDGPFKRVCFSPTQMRELRYATTLHDFGKIGVRENILTKSNRIEPFHFQTIKDRLLLLQRTRENEVAQRKIEILTQPTDEASVILMEELDRSLQNEAETMRADIALLEQANDPFAPYLPDAEYSRLQDLLSRLMEITYQDETGAAQPLLTHEEKEALSVRKGSLTPDEYRQVQDHARMSYDFLRQIPWTSDLRNIANIAHCHHEKLNGKGYPRGIAGAEIPLQARIMTIADIYDALTAADRPYKKAMPVEKALSILKMEVGDGSLDQDLLDLFIAREVYNLTTNWQYNLSDLGLTQSHTASKASTKPPANPARVIVQPSP